MIVVGVVAWLLLGERPSGRILLGAPVVLGVVLISGVMGGGAYGANPGLGVGSGSSPPLPMRATCCCIRRARTPGRFVGPVRDALRPRSSAGSWAGCSWAISSSCRRGPGTAGCSCSRSAPRSPGACSSRRRCRTCRPCDIADPAQPARRDAVFLAAVLLGEAPSPTSCGRRVGPAGVAVGTLPVARGSSGGAGRLRAGVSVAGVGVRASGAGRPRPRRRRPTRGCAQLAGSGGPSYGGRSDRGVSRRGRRPGRRARAMRVGRAASRSVDDVRRHPVGREARRPRGGASAEHRPARLALLGRPQDRAADRSRGPRSATSPSPGPPSHPGGPDQRGVVSRTSARASSMPRMIWPTGPASAGAGPWTRPDAVQRRGDFAGGVGRHDDDRQRPAGPGEVGQPADPRQPSVGRARTRRSRPG